MLTATVMANFKVCYLRCHGVAVSLLLPQASVQSEGVMSSQGAIEKFEKARDTLLAPIRLKHERNKMTAWDFRLDCSGNGSMRGVLAD